MKLYFIALLMSFLATCVFAQEETKPAPFSVSGYLETYYLFDFNKPKNNERPSFAYSHNRHNEVNINLGFIKGAYATHHVRANLAVMTGTYANSNLAAEPGVLKNIYEANVGVKVSSTKNLWIDAGIFTSHIGFESAIGEDCWTLTRSILADNTPYYEAGAKITYTTNNGKWLLAGMILNGWQRIQRVDGSSLPSFGTQLTFKPSAKVTLNSSTFIGTDKPDSARQMRYFHNLYGQFQINESLGVTIGFDYGLEEKTPQTNSLHAWYSPVMVVRWKLSDRLASAFRAEYYDDVHRIIIVTGTPNGFQTFGYSANMDYVVASNVLWRIEVRNLTGRDTIFTDDDGPSHNNLFVSTALAISF